MELAQPALQSSHPDLEPGERRAEFDLRVYRDRFLQPLSDAIGVHPIIAVAPVLFPMLAVLAAVGLVYLNLGWAPMSLLIAGLFAAAPAVFFGQALAMMVLTLRWLRGADGVVRLMPAFLLQVKNDQASFERGERLTATDAVDVAVRAYDSTLLPLAGESLDQSYGKLGSFAFAVYKLTVSKAVRNTLAAAVRHASKDERMGTAIGVLSGAQAIGEWMHAKMARYVVPVRVAIVVLGTFATLISAFFAFALPSMVISAFG
ncbi:MAG: hypothetical protein AAF411_10720 [Myxococcota bacterium]